MSKLTLTSEQFAYVGDGLIDAQVMDQVALSVTLANVHPLLWFRADYVTLIVGDRGAVWEVCDLLLA